MAREFAAGDIINFGDVLDITGKGLSIYGYVWKASTSAMVTLLQRVNGTGTQYWFAWTNPFESDFYFPIWTGGAGVTVFRQYQLNDTASWHHVAVSYDGTLPDPGTNGKAMLYVDGVLRYSITENRDIGTPAGGSFTVKTTTASAAMRLAHLGIHDVGLTIDEITEAMNHGTTLRGRRGYWAMDHANGATEPDLSGNGIDGTVTGTTDFADPPGVTPLPSGPGPRSQGVIIF
jgi:hypothetical protein